MRVIFAIIFAVSTAAAILLYGGDAAAYRHLTPIRGPYAGNEGQTLS
jgi:hypothetical protein